MSVLVNMPGRRVLSKLRVDYDLGPRLPQIDASERADIDRLIHLALAQQARARDIESERSELARILSDVIGEDLRIEVDAAFLTAEQREAHKTAWADFVAFCKDEHLGSLPTTPETVSYYAIRRGADGKSLDELHRALEAIAWIHTLADDAALGASGGCNFNSPTIKGALRFIQRCLDGEAADKTETA